MSSERAAKCSEAYSRLVAGVALGWKLLPSSLTRHWQVMSSIVPMVQNLVFKDGELAVAEEQSSTE